MNEYVFKKIRDVIENKQKSHPFRILINGAQGSGKTMFASELVDFLNSEGFEAFHVTVDRFHNLSNIRYKLGRDSAEGYYKFAYNLDSFYEKVLKPLTEDKPYYIPAIMNLKEDKAIKLDPIYVSSNSVCVIDGAFLLTPKLYDGWDLTIYLQVPIEKAKERGILRDACDLGGLDEAKRKFEQRYHRAYSMYLKENQPEKFADIVIDNSDYTNRSIKLIRCMESNID